MNTDAPLHRSPRSLKDRFWSWWLTTDPELGEVLCGIAGLLVGLWFLFFPVLTNSTAYLAMNELFGFLSQDARGYVWAFIFIANGVSRFYGLFFGSLWLRGAVAIGGTIVYAFMTVGFLYSNPRSLGTASFLPMLLVAFWVQDRLLRANRANRRVSTGE